MICFVKIVQIIVALFFSSFVMASTQLVQQLDELVSTLPKGSVYSIEVKKLSTNQVVYQKKAHANLVPASSLKAITAIFAYDILGKNFRYATQITADRKTIRLGVLNSSVSLNFVGDPSFKRKHLSSMLIQLKKQGINKIQGDFWINKTQFSGYDHAIGVSWDDLNMCYGAPSSAIILNRNCFSGWLKYQKYIDQVTMKYTRPSWRLRVDNKVMVTDNDQKTCDLTVAPSYFSEYQIKGCVSKKTSPIRMNFSVNNVDRMAINSVEWLLKKYKIELSGQVLIGEMPKTKTTILVTHYSKTLPKLLMPILEKSDNLYTDSILKTLGKSNQHSGSFETGVQAMLDFSQEHSLNLSSARLVDGSGLSRYNHISATVMNDVLSYAWRQWKHKAPWLKKYAKKNFWFKSGSMSGIRSMVGYVFNTKEGAFAFSVLINGLSASQEFNHEYYKMIKLFRRQLVQYLLMSNSVASLTK